MISPQSQFAGDVGEFLIRTKTGTILLCTALVLGIKVDNETPEETAERKARIANHVELVAAYLQERGFISRQNGTEDNAA